MSGETEPARILLVETTKPTDPNELSITLGTVWLSGSTKAGNKFELVSGQQLGNTGLTLEVRFGDDTVRKERIDIEAVVRAWFVEMVKDRAEESK